MDDKLVRFLNKINFENKEAFNNSKAIKVTINRQDSTWNVYIENVVCVDIEDALNLIEVAKRGIDGVNSINVIFDNINIKEEDVISYFKYLLNDVVKESPALSSIVNNNITVNEDVITIEVISEIEEKLIKKESKKILKRLEQVGFNDLNINCKINEELKQEIKKEINETRVEVVKKEEPTNTVIMGEMIKSKVTTIDSIIGEENNITVEARNVNEITSAVNIIISFKLNSKNLLENSIIGPMELSGLQSLTSVIAAITYKINLPKYFIILPLYSILYCDWNILNLFACYIIFYD